MKDLAAFLIIILAMFAVIMTGIVAFTDAEWETKRSPKTGICYETRTLATVFGTQSAMSPVDDKYCE